MLQMSWQIWVILVCQLFDRDNSHSISVGPLWTTREWLDLHHHRDTRQHSGLQAGLSYWSERKCVYGRVSRAIENQAAQTTMPPLEDLPTVTVVKLIMLQSIIKFKDPAAAIVQMEWFCFMKRGHCRNAKGKHIDLGASSHFILVHPM